MKTKLIILFGFLLIVFGQTDKICAEKDLCKDATPGGIYIVGPDISPDSLTGDYFYYSADYGSTLVLKYIDPTGCVDFDYISPEVSFGCIYRKNTGHGLWYSTDYGENWNPQSGDCRGHITSGLISGEIYKNAYYIVRSTDYGVTFPDTGEIVPFNDNQVGRTSGELYGIRESNGKLYYSNNYGHSFTLMHYFDRGEDWDVTRGATAGEIYAYNYDTIYYSSDYGETFTRTGCYAGGNKFNEIAGGNNTGELFGLRRFYHEPPMGEWGGGEIEICYSTDYGETFDCVMHRGEILSISGDKSPSIPEEIMINAYPNPFNKSINIEISKQCKTPLLLRIYNVEGNLVYKSNITDKPENRLIAKWEPSEETTTGIYFVQITDNKISESGKIIYLK